jgi:hypothetical protein
MPFGPYPAARMFLLASVALVALGSEALAQSRPLTSRMSCGQARGIVAAQGAVVLNTSPLAYDRYVGSAGSCGLGERTEPAWVPTADNPQCPIGYRCTIGTTPSRN